MKTNQVMTRKMREYEIKQRTKDSMFNATHLIKQWNNHKKMKKSLKDSFGNKQTGEFIEVLKDEESLHGGNYPYVKSRASRGVNAGTWMHPILFVKCASHKMSYTIFKIKKSKIKRFKRLSLSLGGGLRVKKKMK